LNASIEKKISSPWRVNVLITCLKSSSKTDLKTEIVTVSGHVAERTLFVLRDERKLGGNPVFEREYLILILRKIGRVRYSKIIVDLPSDG